MSGLSSRVMNMKFMKSADNVKTAEDDQKHQKKVKDSSEWASAKSRKILANNDNNNVQTVGYGSIHMFDDDSDDDNDVNDNDMIPKTIKRSWGTKNEEDSDPVALEFNSIKESTQGKKKPKSKSQPKPETTKSTPANDNNDNTEFLNSMFQSKKRANEDSDNTPKPNIKNKRKRIKKN